MITSHVWSLTFSSRSHVITTHSRPPSPSAVIVRHQWPIVIAAGRSATTSTRRAPRRSPTAVAPRTAEIVLPTPGSSASRNCRPPAAARAAIASAASNWILRGSSASVGSGLGRRIVGVEGVLDEPPERVRPRGVRREVCGQRAPDVQVGLDGRVPGGAVDLCPVGDVEHPQPLARTGDGNGRARRVPLRRGTRCVDEHWIDEDWPPPDATGVATTNWAGSRGARGTAGRAGAGTTRARRRAPRPGM